MITNNLSDYIKKSQKGKPYGVCGLDANGKVPFENIDLDVNVLEFKGTWDAMINSPLLSNGMSSTYTGNVYICSVAGTQFGTDFETGDFVLYDGSVWKRISGVSYNTFLKVSNNLSDLNNVATARNNLNVYSKTEIDSTDSLNLKIVNDLGDINNKANARTNLGVYSKTEVDNNDAMLQSQISAKVSAISNTDGKITIDNTTPSNPILNISQSFRWGNGAYRGLLYQQASGFGNSTQIATNATIVASISQMSIGFSSYNGGSDSDIASSTKAVLTYIKDNLPYTVRIVDTTNTDNYYTITLNSYGGASGSAYLFNVSYVASQTNMTNIPTLGNNVYLLFDYAGISNKTAIATNTANIATNTANIATNTANITINTANIATNTANISTNATNLTNHINDTTGAHTASAISTNTVGHYISASDAQSNLVQLDNQVFANADDIANGALNLNAHITDTTGAHTASAINTTSNGQYITATNVQTNLTQLDNQVFANTFNISTLNGNKIETLTSGNNFLTITGSPGISRNLTIRCNAYLNGFVNITNTGLLQLAGISQTGHPYSTSGSTMTVLDDLVIDGSFLLSSGGNLVVEGNLIILGAVNIQANTSITARGVIHFRGKSSIDTFVCLGCTFNSYDDFSIRNYDSTAYVSFAGTSPNIINAKTITFENNFTSIYFDSTTTHTLNADNILWNNNTNKASGTGSNPPARLYNVAMNATSIKFTNNTNTGGNYIVELRQDVTLKADIIEFANNVKTTGGGYCIYFGINIAINSMNLTFKDNTHATDLAIYFNNSSAVIASKHIFFLNNGSANGIYSVAGVAIKSDYIHIKTSGAGQSIGYNGTVEGMYSATRVPQYIIDNTGSTITGFNNESFLGMIPFCFKQFVDPVSFYTPTVTTALGALKLNPTTFTFGPTLGAGFNQYQLINTQFDAPTNSQIRYIGRDNAYLKIEAAISFRTALASSQSYVFEVYKNGTIQVAFSAQYSTDNSNDGTTNVNMASIATASPNDYFELSARVGATTTTLSITNINWIMTKLSIM